MSIIDPARLLAVWETGARRHPIDRALLLFALARPEAPPDALADEPLGMRNAAIMRLRQQCFGDALPAWLDCPECGERMEFELDPAMLPPAPTTRPAPFDVAGLRFRVPSSRDLLGTLHTSDPEQAAIALLRACLDPDGGAEGEATELAALIDPVGDAMDAIDPWADLSLTMPCPACGTGVTASLDVAAYFWDELDRHAGRLLDDIHRLASAYGWSEADILDLSHTRRAAYLARINP